MGVDDLVSTYYPGYISLLKKTYSEIGIPMKYNLYPTARGISSFNSNQVHSLDAKIGSINLFCPNAILINPPVMEGFTFGLWKLNSKNIKYDSKTKVVGVRGALYLEVFKKKFSISEERMLYARNRKNAFDLVRVGRADFVIADFVTSANQEFSKDFEFIKDMSLSDNIYHIISPKLIEYKEKIEKAFRDLKDRGLLDIESYKITK